MWRALFLALGAFTCLLGVQALAIERATVKQSAPDNPGAYTYKEVTLPDWAPWSLMSGGVVVVLYSFTLPKKVGG
ncbi:MAG: hypothetical protein AAGA92_08345 [Planctomycetota bacterium]